MYSHKNHQKQSPTHAHWRHEYKSLASLRMSYFWLFFLAASWLIGAWVTMLHTKEVERNIM